MIHLASLRAAIQLLRHTKPHARLVPAARLPSKLREPLRPTEKKARITARRLALGPPAKFRKMMVQRMIRIRRLLINCTFDMDRLKREGLTRAITHVGEHIADLRDPQSNVAESTAYGLEYRAWQTTVLSAVASQQKTLTLPGGYLLWNSTWPATDRSEMVDEGVANFLKAWGL